MWSEREIWLAAKTVIDRYGDGAEMHAAMRADELLAEGDLEGRRAWQRILAAIDELRRTERRPEEPAH